MNCGPTGVDDAVVLACGFESWELMLRMVHQMVEQVWNEGHRLRVRASKLQLLEIFLSYGLSVGYHWSDRGCALQMEYLLLR